MDTNAGTLTGVHTIAGRRRTNQDAVLARVLRDGRHVVALADGMGGHLAGGEASRRALETVMARLEAGGSMRDAVLAANETVYAAALDNPEWAGMGTTLVVLLRAGDEYEIANIGDSRAYRVDAAGVRQLTVDHSYIAEAVASGLTGEAAQRSRWRNALTRAVGTEPSVAVDVFGPFGAAEPHSVVLCSDGLHGSVREEALRSCVEREQDAAAAARQLVDEAYAAGSRDNISAAVIRFGAAARQRRVAGAAAEPQPRALRPPATWVHAPILHVPRPSRRPVRRLRRLLTLAAVLLGIVLLLLAGMR